MTVTISATAIGSAPKPLAAVVSRPGTQVVLLGGSKDPNATLTMVSKSLGEVKWTNTKAWIADNSGQMKPNWSTTYVSTKSCGSGKVNASITVSEKCVEAGAF